MIKNNSKSVEHVVDFLKPVLRALKTVLKSQKKLVFKIRLKHSKWKCLSVLRQRQSCKHDVNNGCKTGKPAYRKTGTRDPRKIGKPGP